MNLKLKVCGMRQPENIKEIAELHPDYLGLIFYEKSPRFVAQTIGQLDSEIRKTGVFVDASEEYILEKVRDYELGAVQFHGSENPQFCLQLKKKLEQENPEVEVIKVFGIKDDFDFKNLEPYEGVVDFYLFDTKGKNKGGNGITFNWKILKDYPSSTPFFLSGGIGEEEVSEIISFYKDFKSRKKEHLFYGLDVNSKFETAPGLKNAEKLKLFKESFS